MSDTLVPEKLTPDELEFVQAWVANAHLYGHADGLIARAFRELEARLTPTVAAETLMAKFAAATLEYGHCDCSPVGVNCEHRKAFLDAERSLADRLASLEDEMTQKEMSAICKLTEPFAQRKKNDR